MVRVTIDRDVCFGSGECVLAAPAVFELDDAGIARFRPDAVPLTAEDAERIAANCPSGALAVSEAASPQPSTGEVRS